MYSNHLQINEMKDYKWGESRKAGYDLGPRCLIEWIEKYGKSWRILYQYCIKNNLDYNTVKHTLCNEIDHIPETQKLEWLDVKIKEWLKDNFPSN